jgi:hypothetical protein
LTVFGDRVFGFALAMLLLLFELKGVSARLWALWGYRLPSSVPASGRNREPEHTQCRRQHDRIALERFPKRPQNRDLRGKNSDRSIQKCQWGERSPTVADAIGEYLPTLICLA